MIDTPKTAWHDVTAVKQRASGRWAEIIPRLAGIEPSLLDGLHHPCPKCGGTDRFRALDDFEETGAVFCNQCFSKANGDGFAALRWLTGADFRTVVAQVADFIGMAVNGNGNGRKHKAAAKAKAEIVARYDYRDEQGKLLYQVCRMEPKDFRQRSPKPGGGWNPTTKGIRRVLYRLPELLAADPAAIVFVVEGEKDADRLTGLGLVATCNAGGAGKWRREYNEHLSGRRVAVLPDNDQPGRDHSCQVGRGLAGLSTWTKVVALPGLFEKGDVSDWLDAGGTVEDLLRLVEEAPEWVPDQSDKPNIDIDPEERPAIDAAIKSLAGCDDVFQRGGMLVHVVRDAPPPRGVLVPPDAPRIVPIRLPLLRERLAEAAIWRKFVDGIPERTHPPEWAVKAVDARGEWPGVRRLEGISETPVLRADGSILQTPGYDPSTGLIFDPVKTFPPIQATPSLADAERARDELLEVVEDFPFASDVHRAGWLAFLLTIQGRFAFVGCSPLFAFDSNVRGAGKGLAADSAANIALGHDAAKMTAAENDAENRKRITALAVAAEQLILIDNVAMKLGSASLDAALTASTWSDRVLGRTEMVRAPLRAVWACTGNNVVFAADTARRALPIRLESREENPEDRSDFHHKDLLGWIRQERVRLASAGLVILAGYFAAGRPDMRLKNWGSFEAWSALIRNAVVWCGLPDPAQNHREMVTSADQEADLLRRLLAGWEEVDESGRGMTVASALREIERYPGRFETLRSAILEITEPGKAPSPRVIGKRLQHLRRRVCGGLYFDRLDSREGAVWSARQLEGRECDSGDSCDSPIDDMHAPAHAPAHGCACAPARPHAEYGTVTTVSTPATVTDEAWSEEDEASYAEFME